MSELVIDLNADLGEIPELLASGADGELMRYISSANIACGAHAGSKEMMRETVALAKSLGVAIGAHPGYPDRENFGRVEMALAPDALEESVRTQISELMDVAAAAGEKVVHIKPHGALYHATNRPETAEAVGRAALALDANFIMVGQCGSASVVRWREMGLQCATEAFADRAYERDGTLRKRTLPGALLESSEAAANQAISIATLGSVTAHDGTALRVAAQTLCLHSDTPGAAAIARVIHERLCTAGVVIRALR
jgi:UPF0271 protein